MRARHLHTEQNQTLDFSEPQMATSDAHRILLVAYACGPGRGSEESVGWDTAEALARHGFHVTVLTRTSERNTCPPPSERHPNLAIVCYDIGSHWQNRFERMGKIGVEAGYLAWLISARPFIKHLHAQLNFDSAQHVTYARYWMPSPLQVLDIPWILGPVGGGESIPRALRSTLSPSGQAFEYVRDLMRWLGERLPSVRKAASMCHIALANTDETAARLRKLGARRVEIMNSAALSDDEYQRLATQRHTEGSDGRRGFVSIGRLLDWKGFHLGLKAFAESGSSETYTVVGTGPFEARLRVLTQELDIESRVRFTGAIPRSEVFSILSSVRALVHPSLHESGGFVCLEAMAAGTPVLCIDTGGPGLFVREGTGIAVAASSETETISELATGMRHLTDSDASGIGNAASAHVGLEHTMKVKAARLFDLHLALVSGESRKQTATSFQSAVEIERSDRLPLQSDKKTANHLKEGVLR